MPAIRFLPTAAWPLGRRPLLSAVAMISLVCGLPVADAQDGDEKKIPPPENVTLKTADAVQLVATYYPGTQKKETVPVILLHMFKGNRNEYSQLAPYLQSLGHAVLVPDLRGHGDSTRRSKIHRTTGNITTGSLEAASMGRNEFFNMVAFDMPRLKHFLLEENNAGELNIEKLCVVGAEMGASVAVNWTYFDWTRPPEGNRKMGQDVKALVLISPQWSTTGLPLRTAMVRPPLRIRVFDPQLKSAFRDPDTINFSLPVALDFRSEVSTLIVVGKSNSKAVRDARRLHALYSVHHDETVPKEQRTLLYTTLDTSLQGTSMLGQKLNLEELTAWFIGLRAAKRSFPWAKRTDPYDRG